MCSVPESADSVIVVLFDERDADYLSVDGWWSASDMWSISKEGCVFNPDIPYVDVMMGRLMERIRHLTYDNGGALLMSVVLVVDGSRYSAVFVGAAVDMTPLVSGMCESWLGEVARNG